MECYDFCFLTQEDSPYTRNTLYSKNLEVSFLMTIMLSLLTERLLNRNIRHSLGGLSEFIVSVLVLW